MREVVRKGNGFPSQKREGKKGESMPIQVIWGNRVQKIFIDERYNREKVLWGGWGSVERQRGGSPIPHWEGGGWKGQRLKIRLLFVGLGGA